MSNLIMSIPHNLSRDEAKRRLQDAIIQARHEYGSMLSGLSERWEGDTLRFVLSVAGQSVSGQVFVEDHAVRLEATLPWLLAMLTGPLQRRIDRHARDALEHKPASPATTASAR